MTDLSEREPIAEGREAEVFDWGDGRILRLLRSAERRPEMRRAAAAMRRAHDLGLPVPTVFDEIEVDGRPGLVMERVDGRDMLTMLSVKPWTAVKCARALGSLHASTHEITAPPEVWSLHDYVRHRIDAAGSLPARLARFALGLLDDLPDGDRLCHGDFHPGNVLVGPDAPVIIDWTNASRGDPAGDVARTRLMLTMGALPPGHSAPLRHLANVGRSFLYRRYLHAYGARRPIDRALMDRWTVVRAADRFSEGIEDEYPALEELLTRAARS